jgi:hypothetical protein
MHFASEFAKREDKDLRLTCSKSLCHFKDPTHPPGQFMGLSPNTCFSTSKWNMLSCTG